MSNKYHEALQLAGKLADSVRKLVGGSDISGLWWDEPTIRNAAALIPEIRERLDAYDNAILELHCENK